MTYRILCVTSMIGWAALTGCVGDDVWNEGIPDGGTIIKENCTAGQKKCEADTLKTCNSEGNQWIVQNCVNAGAKCLVLGGVAQCKTVLCMPENISCAKDGLTTRTCAKDGNNWVNGKACDPKQGEICYGGICQKSCKIEAQSKQNVGCTFYPVNLDNQRKDKVGVVVSNPNKWASTVSLSDSSGPMESRQVQPGKLETFIIPLGKNMLVGSGKQSYAFKLTSTLPIAAYQFSPQNKAEQRSNDASLLLAKEALGKVYYVMTTLVALANGRSYVTVVATEPGTQVTVTPTVSTAAGGSVPAVTQGQPYTVTLNEMEILQLATKTKNADMTGTKVKASKPVAVFGGNSCANLPSNKMYCDHVQEQMFPVETWGKGYLAVKFMPRGQTPEDDWWRIMASEDNTKVTITGATGLAAVPTLKAGQHFQINTPKAFVVKANKPISLGHYMLGQGAVSLPLNKSVYNETFQTPKGCAIGSSYTSMGDPAISVSVPFEQYRKQYIFLTPDTYRYDFVTVTVPDKKETPQVMLDGKPIPVQLQKIGNTNFRFARFRVTDGPHTMSGTTPFGIEVYGYDCNVSYAYSGGLSLKVINPIK